MTWTEFCTALKDVAGNGTITGGDHVRTSMTGLGMVTGSNADEAGLVLTETGRKWHKRVTDRQAERDLAAFASALGQVMDFPRRTP